MEQGQFLERRTFLKVAFGFAAGAAALAASAQAAPLMPPANTLKDKELSPEPAVATQDDLDNARIEQVQWGRRRRWRRWGRRRRRFWGWRRRRFYGFRRRRWRRRWFRRRRYW